MSAPVLIGQEKIGSMTDYSEGSNLPLCRGCGRRPSTHHGLCRKCWTRVVEREEANWREEWERRPRFFGEKLCRACGTAIFWFTDEEGTRVGECDGCDAIVYVSYKPTASDADLSGAESDGMRPTEVDWETLDRMQAGSTPEEPFAYGKRWRRWRTRGRKSPVKKRRTDSP